MPARQAIVTREVSFNISRRLDRTTDNANLTGVTARVTLELMGPVDEETGRVIDPAVLDRIVRERLLDTFDMMLVVRLTDPFLETLSNKPLINNAGWDELVVTMRTAINEAGYYDSRRQAMPTFYNQVQPLVVAELPTAENLAYLIHRLLAPHLYNYGIQQMRVKFGERDGQAAVFVGDVRPTPNFPQIA